MKVREIIDYINTFASEKWQYPWDNSGLQVGNAGDELKGILVCVDVLEKVVDEAVEKGCNLIISHHPLLFAGVKRITDDKKSTIIRKLIKNDISVYSSHTSFDVSDYSMNHYIASNLGLENVRYLDNLSEMKCSFSVTLAKECSLEDLEEIFDSVNAENITLVRTQADRTIITGSCFSSLSGKLIQKLHRINDENYVTVTEAKNIDSNIGLGLIGNLTEKVPVVDVIKDISRICGCSTIKVSSNYADKKVRTIAVCSGSGSDYLKTAMRNGADLYICADLKWSDFLVCEEGSLVAVCPTHFESEQSFISIMKAKLSEYDRNMEIFESSCPDIEVFLNFD